MRNKDKISAVDKRSVGPKSPAEQNRNFKFDTDYVYWWKQVIAREL